MLGSLPERPNDAERENAVLVGRLLIEHDAQIAWPVVWATMPRDTEFGQALAVALSDDWDLDEGWLRRLPDAALGHLSLWLEQQFPRDDGAKGTRNRWPSRWCGKRFDIELMRDKSLAALVDRGTPTAVATIARLCEEFPDYPWLRVRLADARETLRRVS